MKFDRLEFKKEDNSTTFLDLKIRIEDMKIHTDLYRKDNDKATALYQTLLILGTLYQT